MSGPNAYRTLRGWCVPDGEGGFREGFYADPEGRMLLLVPALEEVEDNPPPRRWGRRGRWTGRRMMPDLAFRPGVEP